MHDQNRPEWQMVIVRSNPAMLTAVVGSAVVMISVGLTWVLGSFFIPPEKMLRSLSLAVLIPSMLAPPIVWILANLLRQLQAAEIQQRELVEELTKKVSEIKTLQGLLPICAGCKDVRDDSGSWHKMETFLAERTDAEFSHAFCPDCLHELYPDFAAEIIAKRENQEHQDAASTGAQTPNK